LRWGLIPVWAKEASMGSRMINARSETAAEKPSFRTAFKRRRCLIPADGFYEWRKIGKRKQPYHIHFTAGRPFTMAGLWESWSKGPEGTLETFTILTTAANKAISGLHHRMPVILEGDARELWLDSSVQNPELLSSLLVPHRGASLHLTPVSTLVNNVRNESPQCLVPVTLEEGALEE
jgi:putative SOS response-associated peptidase YedK